jgi:hypothetical protein
MKPGGPEGFGFSIRRAIGPIWGKVYVAALGSKKCKKEYGNRRRSAVLLNNMSVCHNHRGKPMAILGFCQCQICLDWNVS